MKVQELMSRIESCQGLVRSIALGVHKRTGGAHELDDLIAYGQVGLAQASSEFDPSRGSQLSTFAYYRIRGAIYDGVAKMAGEQLAARRDAAWNEILAEDAENQDEKPTSGSSNWLESIAEQMATASLLNTAGNTPSTEIADETASQPDDELCREEMKVQLHQLVDQLPEESAELIRQTYFQGLSMQEAAANLGMSKSWASRLHAKALQSLGDHLRRMGLDD